MVPEIDRQRPAEAHATDAPAIGVPGARLTPHGPLSPKPGEPPRGRPVHVLRRSGGRNGPATALPHGPGIDAPGACGGTAVRTRTGRTAVTPDIPAPTEEIR
ncbi:MAG TPA: rhodanese-like domain-containing protein [Streptomyces sp.]|nr:rhodanese-like domain-containing protein [Streptomyces sp.]